MSTTTAIAKRSRRLAERVAHGRRIEPAWTRPAWPASVRPLHRELASREPAAPASRIRATDLVHEHGTSPLMLDLDRVTTQLLKLRHELPDVQIHFAVKSLPHPALIRAVDAFGASFAVASRSEVDLLERERVAISRCLHIHPVKTVADITGAYLRGIRTFVVDSLDEVAKFRELPEVAVLVRLSFPNPRAKSERSSTSGIAPEDAGALVGQCLRAGIRVAGFTFHVGSRTTSAAPWMHAIRRTLALMRRLEHAYGIRFDTLDLGGGFPVADGERGHDLGTLARGIRAALSAAPSRYRIVIEPGRFISAPAVVAAA
jgi:ornithine decarboxylase